MIFMSRGPLWAGYIPSLQPPVGRLAHNPPSAAGAKKPPRSGEVFFAVRGGAIFTKQRRAYSEKCTIFLKKQGRYFYNLIGTFLPCTRSRGRMGAKIPESVPLLTAK